MTTVNYSDFTSPAGGYFFSFFFFSFLFFLNEENVISVTDDCAG